MSRKPCSRLIATVTVLIGLAGASLIGCGGGGLTEADIVTKLEGTGLQVEKLPRPTWTRNQRERVEQKPEAVFSLKLTDEAGSHQEVTVLGFDAEWKADGVAPDGVPGFAVGTWFFVGQIGQSFRSKIEAAMQ